MKSYALKCTFDREDVLFLKAAELIVRVFPDRDLESRLLRCHEVARAMQRILRSRFLSLPHPVVVDGKFDRVDHSWLAWRGRDGALRILDPYAVGSLPQVQIFVVALGLKRGDYEPDHLPRSDVLDEVVEWLVRRFNDCVPTSDITDLCKGIGAEASTS